MMGLPEPSLAVTALHRWPTWKGCRRGWICRILFAKSIHWMTTTTDPLAVIMTCNDLSVLTALRRHSLHGMLPSMLLTLLVREIKTVISIGIETNRYFDDTYVHHYGDVWHEDGSVAGPARVGRVVAARRPAEMSPAARSFSLPAAPHWRHVHTSRASTGVDRAFDLVGWLMSFASITVGHLCRVLSSCRCSSSRRLRSWHLL